MLRVNRQFNFKHLMVQPPLTHLSLSVANEIRSTLEIESDRFSRHLNTAKQSGRAIEFAGVILPAPLQHCPTSLVWNSKARDRVRQARRLANIFLRNPLKVVDLQDVPRILSEGLLSRRRRNRHTILDTLKIHEDRIHLACGLPYKRRLSANQRDNAPKAMILFFGEMLWQRVDFLLSITDTGVLFRENNYFGQWIRQMNQRFRETYGTPLQPSRLAVDRLASSPEFIATTRQTMRRVYKMSSLPERKAKNYLTSLLLNHFPLSGAEGGWMSEAWVEPGLLPELHVGGEISPSAIKAVCCAEEEVETLQKAIPSLTVPIIPINGCGPSTKLHIADVVNAYDSATGAGPSLAEYANWLRRCDSLARDY